MFVRRLACGFPVLALLLCLGCASGPYARHATVGGGLAGGAIGALAGVPSDRSLEGAAIGAVAGSVLGNLTGDLADRDAAYASAEQQAYLQQVRQRAVTIDQVLQMSASGVGEHLIINQIRNNGVLSSLTPNDVIALKQGGVSDNVIAAWQQMPPGGAVLAGPPVQPVIVQPVVHPVVEPVYGPDCFHFHYSRFGRRRPHRWH